MSPKRRSSGVMFLGTQLDSSLEKFLNHARSEHHIQAVHKTCFWRRFTRS